MRQTGANTEGSCWKQGLSPQIADDCRIVILGSMPGEASLQAGQYYAHPRNRFWPLLGRLYGFDPALPYDERVCMLWAAGIGLWDVLDQCERQGSLDSAIKRDSEVANPLPARLCALTGLRLIVLNGGKAAQAFRRHVALDAGMRLLLDRIDCLSLPSTSPANASFDMARLFAAWSALKNH
ncbi:MAG: DNA-deoxyinosine glycosylase [Xanthomonadaceae bacterium]|nr:DNA-deoxyinosine glycosylase [Xanthomonadaceae bacterium]